MIANAHPLPEDDGLAEINSLEEAGKVLRALRSLRKQISSPIIRVCLEEAMQDIDHLTSADEDTEEETAAG